jgi:hypothetical protein
VINCIQLPGNTDSLGAFPELKGDAARGMSTYRGSHNAMELLT